MKITKLNFQSIAKMLGYQIDPEFKFISDREFRADWKVNKDGRACLVEYEGIKGRSRHTSITGYSKDCEKYNLAALAGYTVLRYTVLNFDSVFDDLERFFENK